MPGPRDTVAGLRVRPCSSCGAAMVWVLNIDTNKPGPCIPSASIYVLERPPLVEPEDAPLYASTVPAPYNARTLKAFLEDAQEIVMKNGRRVAVGDLRFLVSHFVNCPNAGQHSRQNRK